jgi:aminopeptidase-like protein
MSYGYDEKQFFSPGFDSPVGCFMRTLNGCFLEDYTSADNPDLSTHQRWRMKCGRVVDIRRGTLNT